jgi:hypothetical protein
MQIIFSNGDSVDLILADNSLAAVYKKIYKHLQHLAVPFREWNNPYYSIGLDQHARADKLVDCGKRLGLEVDREQCFQQNQDYLNHIHQIYEDNYDGNPDWLDFNKYIHLCESEGEKRNFKIFQIDYGEKAGMLEKPFDHKWLVNSTTKIKAGDVFVNWSELGKTPYTYWRNNEAPDIARLCELSKPWLKLRPKIMVALEDMDWLEGIDVEGFNKWWKDYSEPWCRYWNINKWDINDIFAVSVFGTVPEFEKIITQLQNNTVPVQVLQ